jgi:hypothetical protein
MSDLRDEVTGTSELPTFTETCSGQVAAFPINVDSSAPLWSPGLSLPCAQGLLGSSFAALGDFPPFRSELEHSYTVVLCRRDQGTMLPMEFHFLSFVKSFN